MKKILLLILFPINFLFAFEVTCNFEEVYQNNEIQQGVFLIKGKNLRYQYYNQDLFTIIVNNVMNCKFNEINKKYFKHFNFEEYSG